MSKSHSYRQRQQRGQSTPKMGWLAYIAYRLGQWWRRDQGGDARPSGLGLGLGALLSALDWDQIREEVDRENRAQIALAGSVGAGKSTLIKHLRGKDAPETCLDPQVIGEPFVRDHGLFAVIDIPAQPPDGHLAEGEPAWLAFQNADMVLWLLDGEAGMRPWEYEWICRVRAMGKTLAVALNKLDLVDDAGQIEHTSRALGCPVAPISAQYGTNIASRLLPLIADASPALITAMGRESPTWRHVAAQRVTRRAAALSGLIGLEPLPLLDIPFQAMVQLRLILRLAAIYGEPLNDRYSREMLATIVSGLALRYVGQQVAKAVPVLGWGLSAGLAASGTWLIGRVAAEYFENGRHVRPPAFHFQRISWDKDKGLPLYRLWQRERQDGQDRG